MTALLLEDATPSIATPLRRRTLLAGGDERRDEKWLQDLLFRHPELLPLDEIDPDAGAILPLCRELPLPRAGGSVYPDLLGVTRSGRLVIIECKLWRNPQARREVVAQITEYAALLRRWSYTDLAERLKQKERWSGAHPLYERAKAVWPDLNEARFVDGVTRSLASGDFHLLIVGDGIRSDLMALVEHMAGGHAGLARLGLVEILLWSDDAGRTVVLPRAALRTEVVTHRVLLSETGQPVVVAPEPLTGVVAEETEEQSGVASSRDPAKIAENREFWQRFIDEARFEHADQPAPRHGGNNSVRLAMPGDAPWITAYRLGGNEIGLFLRLRGEQGQLTFSQLEADSAAMRAESGLDIRFDVKQEEPFLALVQVYTTRANLGGDDGELAWIKATADRFVSAIRPRLKALYAAEA